MTGPYDDLRILDFTRYYAGPFGTYQFALQGADVIKIEPPGGEEYREAQLDPVWAQRKLAPAYMSVNANKRSIILDLRTDEAQDIVRRLVKSADIVWENFRPGVMDRFGLGYEALRQINPRLIYCAVSGFGQTGPAAHQAAFDGKIQAMSGIMAMTGDAAGGPTRAGFAVCDLIAGMTAAFAVSTALHHRQRTGQGQMVDVALLDATLNFLTQHVTEYTVSGHVQQQYGNLSVTRKPTADRFRCGEGYVVLAALTERQFQALMKTLGRPEALDDPRFADWPKRMENTAELRRIIEEAMATGDPLTWEARLTAADVPCSRIMSVDEIVAHPQVTHRQLLHTVDSEYGPLRLVGSGFKLEHGGGEVTRAPASPGAHTAEILAEAGYTRAEIDAFLGQLAG
ncbi:CaiB/BaiF CoA-transferase family protein [Acidocella sp.]|uniref:CaiB/BaiF CoA transferase family protein n=1 Tax=Acidocella sp. TaxID=50710 RepID=UPI00263334A8|nr:CoA transferase [Acidocella sp.]